MPETSAARYKAATLKELEGLKLKCVTPVPRSAVPPGIKIYYASVNWVTKFINGIYDKTKCRACFAGNTYDKTHSDCYAPVCKFISVLIVLCLSAMVGWFITGLDYEMAYLNAPLDEDLHASSTMHARIQLKWQRTLLVMRHLYLRSSRQWSSMDQAPCYCSD
jgi:hypothetical protein